MPKLGACQGSRLNSCPQEVQLQVFTASHSGPQAVRRLIAAVQALHEPLSTRTMQAAWPHSAAWRIRLHASATLARAESLGGQQCDGVSTPAPSLPPCTLLGGDTPLR